MTDLDQLARGLSEAQRRTLLDAKDLADGRMLIPAYSVPDHLTVGYSVHRSALNRVGLALRAHLRPQGGA
jgi:hypothetical protein